MGMLFNPLGLIKCCMYTSKEPDERQWSYCKVLGTRHRFKNISALAGGSVGWSIVSNTPKGQPVNVPLTLMLLSLSPKGNKNISASTD